MNAMFREIAVEMNAMQRQMAAFAAMPMPSPEQVIRAALGPGGWIQVQPNNEAVFTSVSGPSGSCSETITYSYHGSAGQPIVRVSHRGDACGSVQFNGTAPVQVEMPRVTPRVLPRPVPTRPDRQLIEAHYRSASRSG